MTQRKEQTQIIPAQPGFYRLQMNDNIGGEGGPFSSRDVIVAWHITVTEPATDMTFHDVIPITTDGGTDGEYAILHPDGTVCWQFIADYENQKDWEAAVILARAPTQTKGKTT